LDLNLEAYAIGIVTLFYIAFAAMFYWNEKLSEEQRERAAFKYFTLYGKGVVFWVSIQFVVILVGVLLLLALG
jgi:dipeptide/tripeptide permease